MIRLDTAQTGAFLRNCEDAYILIHRSPDGDCIGSGFWAFSGVRTARGG